jgi:hypothetical protein
MDSNQISANSIELNRFQDISERDTFTEERYVQMVKCAKKKDTLLDLGCNTGRGGSIIKKSYPFCKLDGIEIVSERIEKIPKGIYRTIYWNSVEKVNYAENKYDAIMGGEFAEHISLTLFEEMLILFKKILNPDGVVIFTTPNPEYFMIRLGKRGVMEDSSHVNIMCIQFFKELLNRFGYKNIKVQGTGRVSKIIGTGFPLLSIYGSYLITADLNPEI